MDLNFLEIPLILLVVIGGCTMYKSGIREDQIRLEKIKIQTKDCKSEVRSVPELK